MNMKTLYNPIVNLGVRSMTGYMNKAEQQCFADIRTLNTEEGSFPCENLIDRATWNGMKANWFRRQRDKLERYNAS